MKKRKQKASTKTTDDWKNSICAKCPGLCCTYITIDVDEPKDDEDLDNLRWYLVHDGISILVEDERWLVKIDTRCEHLQDDYRCLIYDKRPNACREYDAENCDYRTQCEGRPTAYREFVDFERLRRYIKGRWARARRSRKKRRAKR